MSLGSLRHFIVGGFFCSLPEFSVFQKRSHYRTPQAGQELCPVLSQERTKTIRCPVHGDMEFPSDLIRLIDTREFQRLRGVHQLGTAYLVYPGAVHSRFEHSLGTCWLASQLLERLAPDLSPHESLPILAAALVHDLTHIPFGHTLEDERRLFERHDAPSRVKKFLPRGDLGRQLKSLGILDEVLRILLDDTLWQNQIFAGAVAADLLDYLARDAYFCGLSQRYDKRIFQLFRLSAEGMLYLEAQKGGVVRQDALSEIIHLLRIRYFLSERVYFHHTKTVSGAMVSRAVEAALREGLTLDEIACQTDEGLLSLLEFRFGEVPVIGSLLQGLRSRKLYKRVYLLTADLALERRQEFVDRFHKSAMKRSQAETELAKSIGLQSQDLIVYCPALKMQLKEARLPVKVDAGPCRLLDELPVDEIGVLKERHRRLWRFYVFLHPDKMELADKLSAACESYFGESNHLPRFQTGQLYLGL